MPIPVLDLPWWGVVLVTLGLTQLTILSVTVFLHRHQAHRALTLHPAISHAFRFWLWLSTGMITREWVAIHRKHHATTDTADDPHSPQIHGIRKVLLEGAELYREESCCAATIEKYGHHTPDDWIERRLYTRHSQLGIGFMLILDLLLFGPIGLTVWAVQMLWIPFFAAGVINGIGHYWGYRNFASSDASRNIAPWGVLIGGEELHNNHHAYISSAKFSNRWWEFDSGWALIRLLELLGLAQVSRLAPTIRYNTAKQRCDADTLASVLTHRFDVLAGFARAVSGVSRDALHRLASGAQPPSLRDVTLRDAVRHWLWASVGTLPEPERRALEDALPASAVLRTLYGLREDLAALWRRSDASTAQLTAQLERWCQRAETSGIAALHDFSQTLRSYESVAARP
ncbi:DesA family fatty acid desaturase [Denitromonas ohlonensis]|uniref:Acyl-CoA desaturase n=2 Tax=Denitromonas TaxID=139331 RepID=A0A558E502_9RHOO|nr:fatty acid desaturase [Denitromonas ohlonensis]TVO67946.1 acyl-CoA desaturase [Denitromonas ohlonensis]TVO78149.1 acyl-CoA desaturase [Denitromonas ohlonensis]TVT68149.1 MAG: acyl-CoA desaturase [Denitromonas halophila]